MKSIRRMAVGLLGVGALCAAAMVVSASAAKKKAGGVSTGSLSVRYEWRNGTVAPPYHYEYTILLGPGTRGQMLMRPGYPDPGIKSMEWKESFTFAPQARDRLRATMWAHGVFTRSWSEASGMNRPVGGGTENLQVKANERTFIIPAFVGGEASRADAQAVYTAINALVPEAARARLEARQKKYTEQALKARG